MAGKVNRRKVEKELKKLHWGYIVIMLLCFLVGAAGGMFFAKTQIGGDKLELNGERNITVNSVEDYTYEDEGITCISKGKDISDKVEIKTNMTLAEDGKYTLGNGIKSEYYITYTVTEGRYAGLARVRIFTVSPDAYNSVEGGNG